jgi:hypothetical protein
MVDRSLLFDKLGSLGASVGALVFGVRGGRDGSEGVKGRRDEVEEMRDISELPVRWYTVVFILEVSRVLAPYGS